MIDKSILDAFAIQGEITRLSGGQQNSYRVGNYVVKFNDGDNRKYDYIANILLSINNPQYRIAKPVKSIYGEYVREGYIVLNYEEGEHDVDNIAETLQLSKLLRQDLQNFDIEQLEQVDNQWSYAMDILFRQRGFPEYVTEKHKLICTNLLRKMENYSGELQIIHADLGGNVIFHNSLPPCVIDFSPNVAPPKLQEAIIVSDAIAWGSKTEEIFNLLDDFESYRLFLKYAVLFRIITMACKKGVSNHEFDGEYNHYMKVWSLL